MILLLGAEIAHASEDYETYGFDPDYFRISRYSGKFLTLRIVHILVRGFSFGERPASAEEISSALEIPARLVVHLLEELTETGIVTQTTGSRKNEVAFQPGRTIEKITLKHALEEYEMNGGIPIPDAPSEEAEKISRHLKFISEDTEKSRGNVPLGAI